VHVCLPRSGTNQNTVARIRQDHEPDGAGEAIQYRPSACAKGTDNAVKGADDAVKGTDNAVEGTDDAVKGADDAVKGTDNAVKGTDDAVKGADDAVKGTDDAVKGTDNAVKGTDNAVKGTDKDKNNMALMPARVLRSHECMPSASIVLDAARRLQPHAASLVACMHGLRCSACCICSLHVAWYVVARMRARDGRQRCERAASIAPARPAKAPGRRERCEAELEGNTHCCACACVSVEWEGREREAEAGASVNQNSTRAGPGLLG
jgi:hypothetical protein